MHLLVPAALSLCALAGCHSGGVAPTGAAATARADPREHPCRVELGKGLDVVVLGSGGPRADGRAGSGYVIALDGVARVLVDVGPGTFVRLGQSKIDSARLDTVLLTHLHIDHAGDLPGFVKSRDLSANEPLRFDIYGPAARGEYPSTSAYVDRLFGESGAYAYLRGFRNELDIVTTDLDIDLAAPVRTIVEDGALRVRTVAVDHGDVPAVAYRIEYGGRTAVFSGDLASRQARIEELARDADLLVYDAAVLEPPAHPEVLYTLHTTPSRIGEVAAGAAVHTLLLSHISSAVDGHREQVMAAVKRTFKGDVRFAEDCMHLPLGRAPGH